MPGAQRSDVHVRCLKRDLRLRRASASLWISGVLSPDMSGVFPGLLRSGDAAWMADQWLEVPDMQRRCINVARVALGRASGREWYWAYNLILKCVESWPYINGMLVRQGVRADTEPLADFLDAAYTLMRELRDDKGRTALDSELSRIPKDAIASGIKPKMSGRGDLMAFARD